MGNSSQQFRGSRLHVLTLLDQVDYVQQMNSLLVGSGVSVCSTDKHIPVGSADPREDMLADFLEKHTSFSVQSPDEWWVPRQYTNPTWDMLSTCMINGKSGILLVEAKAHESELSYSGKTLSPSASPQSEANHKKIGECIDCASQLLSGSIKGVSLDINSHYQLANRVACAVKLAECGVPVALLYLGFLGDRYFSDYFKDSEHWQRVMGAYMHGVLPMSFADTIVPLAQGSMHFLIRSLAIGHSGSTEGTPQNEAVV